MHPWMLVETTRVTEFEYYFLLVHIRAFSAPIFCHESWQNDICNFRAMNVTLTLSFKLITFSTFIFAVLLEYNFRHLALIHRKR